MLRLATKIGPQVTDRFNHYYRLYEWCRRSANYQVVREQLALGQLLTVPNQGLVFRNTCWGQSRIQKDYADLVARDAELILKIPREYQLGAIDSVTGESPNWFIIPRLQAVLTQAEDCLELLCHFNARMGLLLIKDPLARECLKYESMRPTYLGIDPLIRKKAAALE